MNTHSMTSVTCAAGPSVKCEDDLEDIALLWKQYLKFLINFQLPKLLKIQYLPPQP